MILRSLSMATALLFLAACGSEAETIELPAKSEEATPTDLQQDFSGPERRIMAFGDSLFAGYGIGLENSYPAKLQEAMRQNGINAVIKNAAVSGETSGAGAQRLAFALDNQEEKPDLVLLELGGNDMLRGLSPDETRANFVSMLDELQRRDIPVLLMGMRAPPNYGPEYQQAFDSIYPELAEEYDVQLVPFWLDSIYQDTSLFQDDRVHPTQAGIDRLVADTLDEVREALPPVD